VQYIEAVTQSWFLSADNKRNFTLRDRCRWRSRRVHCAADKIAASGGDLTVQLACAIRVGTAEIDQSTAGFHASQHPVFAIDRSAYFNCGRQQNDGDFAHRLCWRDSGDPASSPQFGHSVGVQIKDL